jgi:hypothetical protein
VNEQRLRLFSYKMTHDTGFAPNPFWGVLTLATCKPGIRRTKKEGDWIAGFTSQELCGDTVGAERLVFLMQATKPLSIAEYFRSKAYQAKIPKPNSSRAVERTGDNIYRPIKALPRSFRDFEQLRNPHHWDGNASCTKTAGGTKQHDLSGLFVIPAVRYVYLGRNALQIPGPVRPEVPKGQTAAGALTRDEARIRAFIEYVFSHAKDRNVLAPPHDWPAGDDSWQNADG